MHSKYSFTYLLSYTLKIITYLLVAGDNHEHSVAGQCHNITTNLCYRKRCLCDAQSNNTHMVWS